MTASVYHALMQHPGIGKKNSANTEKNPTNSPKNLGKSVARGKRKGKNIYIQPDPI